MKSGVKFPEELTWIGGEKFIWFGEVFKLVVGGGEKVMALMVLLSSLVYMGATPATLPISVCNSLS